MNVLNAIHTRQSIGKVKPDPLPPELIETLLEAAVQAPNHHKVHPWRFFVLTGEARARLGEVMAESMIQTTPDVKPDAVEIERKKPLRAPVVIAVGVDLPANPKVLLVENICAAAAAVQNMLLAAVELGLGAMWRTGPAAEDPRVKQFLGLAPDQPLIGFVYVGYPEGEKPPAVRPSHNDRTTWLA